MVSVVGPKPVINAEEVDQCREVGARERSARKAERKRAREVERQRHQDIQSKREVETERGIEGERDYTKFNCTGDVRIKSVNKFSARVGFEPAIPDCEDRHATIVYHRRQQYRFALPWSIRSSRYNERERETEREREIEMERERERER